MQRTHILLIVGLLALLIAGMFVFAFLSRSGDFGRQNDPVEVPAGISDTAPEITSISAKHYYTDPPGVHTLAGEVLLPTPCDLLNTNVVLLDESTRALVSFDVTNNMGDSCEKKPTTQRFKTGFKAQKDIKIEAVFNGKPIELKLTPAAEGESPADFVLYDKG